MSVADRLFDVRDARVIVTGAASGLGLAMAEVMAAGGAKVTMADLNPEMLAEAKGELEQTGAELRTAELDVSDRGQVDEVFDAAVAEWGGVDVVYANAGISLEPGFTNPAGGLDSIEDEHWEAVLGVNLNGVVHTMGAAARAMKKQGSGKIVVTASNAGLKVEPLVGYSYAATKAAVIHIVKQAAIELAPHGINVNALAPGPTWVREGPAPALDKAPVPSGEPLADTIADRLARLPLGHWGEPMEQGKAAVFLASAMSDFVTGAYLPVDGGWLLL